MPAYDAAGTIAASIESVLLQTYPNWELIVVDDMSSDGTGAIVEKLLRQERRISYLPNDCRMNVGLTRNRGLDIAQGRFVAFLDSDDLWHPRKLELQIDWIASASTAVTYGPYQRMSDDGRKLGMVTPPRELTYEKLFRSNHIGCLTAMFDRSRLPELRFKDVPNEDWIFWLDALRTIDAPISSTPAPFPLGWYRVHANSLSGNKIQQGFRRWSAYRQVFGLGHLQSAFLMVQYMFNALRKRL